MITVKDFIDRFEKYCPLSLAEENDPCGLHFGQVNQNVSSIMISLDCRPEVIKEAIHKKVDLLVVKHPPIFNSIKNFVEDNPQTLMYADIIKNNIAVYAAHTNMDIINNGLNDWFCEILGIKDTTFLFETHTFSSKKIKFLIPSNELAMYKKLFTEFNITDAVYCTIDKLGDNSQQSFQIQATLNFENEQAILSALNEIDSFHNFPYELFEIKNQQTKFGIGRIGILEKPITFFEFAEKVKSVFNLPHLLYISDNPNQLVQRIAICGGTGGKLFPVALHKKADVYITGDVYYHTGHDMLSSGLNIIDPGHYIESICIERLADLFEEWKKELDWNVLIKPSTVNTNPFHYL